MKLESSPLAQLGALIFVAAAVMGLAAWQGMRSAREQLEPDIPPQPPSGFMGIRHAQISDELAQRLGLDSSDGVVIVEVIEGSPAQAAGLRATDIIRQMDDSPISDLSDLRDKMRDSKPGEHMSVHVLRGRQMMQFTVTLTTRPPVTTPSPPQRPF